jgi:hypothetical protein
VIEDPVDPARHREQILWVQRRDERGEQRIAQLALGDVGFVLDRVMSTPSAPPIVTMPPIALATAPPTSSGPSRLNTAASASACRGRAARVATSVAITLDASCKPFVIANANASTMAAMNTPSTAIRARAARRRRA